jgi:hypothetical protein
MEVKYPETIINKSSGLNSSEAFLKQICESSFLSLWSYPNVYRNQGRTASSQNVRMGDGKELCDILVVFENHVIIFSDKECQFPNGDDLCLNWSRWYKRAIRDSAKQIWGAERWIKCFPDSIYLDKDCTTPFPLEIPKEHNIVFHRIVVAHGASCACKEHFGGTGSLMIFPDIIGDMHIGCSKHECLPFAIGQIDPSKGYVHVFDDTTLNIVMSTVDTVSDFISYLSRKEEFILSGRLLSATGEDDLLAFYLRSYNERGEHTFLPDSTNGFDVITIDEGLWDEFANSPARKSQIEADEISYSWDKLVEKFIHHITTGTSYLMSHPDIRIQETIFRFLAKENRLRRRMLSIMLHDMISRTPSENGRATRVIPPSKSGEPYYVLFLLPLSNSIPYEEYRSARRTLLEDYLHILKLNNHDAVDIIGIATESGLNENRSEDIVYLDAHEWTEEQNDYARERESELTNMGLLAERKMFSSVMHEYPDMQWQKSRASMKGNERNLACKCGSGKKYKKCCGAQ